jgi:hypothetical protein
MNPNRTHATANCRYQFAIARALMAALLLSLSFSFSLAQKEKESPDHDRLGYQYDIWPNQHDLFLKSWDSLQAVRTERDRDIRMKAGLLSDSIFTSEGKIALSHQYDALGRTTETIKWFNWREDPATPLSIEQWEYHPETGKVALHREIEQPNDEWERDSSEQYFNPQGNLIRSKSAYFLRDVNMTPPADESEIFDPEGRLISYTLRNINERGDWDTTLVEQYIYDALGNVVTEIEVCIQEDYRVITETAKLYNGQGQVLQSATALGNYLGIVPLAWDSAGKRVTHREFPRYFEKVGGHWAMKEGKSFKEDTRWAYRNGRLHTVHLANPLLREPFLTERHEYDSLGQRLLAKYLYFPGVMAVIQAFEYDQNGYLSRWVTVDGLPWLQYIFYFAPTYELAGHLNTKDQTFTGSWPMTLMDRTYQNDKNGNCIRYSLEYNDCYLPYSEEYSWYPDGRSRHYRKLHGHKPGEDIENTTYTYDEDGLLLQLEVSKNNGLGTYKTIFRRSYIKR